MAARLNSCIGYLLIFVIILVSLNSINIKASSAAAAAKSTSTYALFIFGDSTVDAGNNNYIDTISDNRADLKPYGRNGFFQEPTGRFSDGRIIVDYIGNICRFC